MVEVIGALAMAMAMAGSHAVRNMQILTSPLPLSCERAYIIRTMNEEFRYISSEKHSQFVNNGK